MRICFFELRFLIVSAVHIAGIFAFGTSAVYDRVAGFCSCAKYHGDFNTEFLTYCKFAYLVMFTFIAAVSGRNNAFSQALCFCISDLSECFDGNRDTYIYILISYLGTAYLFFFRSFCCLKIVFHIKISLLI